MHFLAYYIAFHLSWIVPSYLYAIERPRPPTVITRPYEPVEIPKGTVEVIPVPEGPPVETDEPIDTDIIITLPEYT